MSNNELEEGELKKNIHIMKAITDEELNDYTKIVGAVKHEIATLTDSNTIAIDNILRQYEMFKNLHGWLHKLKEKDLPIPTSQEELIDRFKAEAGSKKSKVLKFRNRKIKFSKKQKKDIQKIGYEKVIY